MTTLQRLMRFFDWPESEARPILDAMAAGAGGVEELASLPPSKFASAACRAAVELARKSEAGSPPLPDRVDHLVTVADRAASSENETRRSIVAANLAEIARAIADRPGVPIVLVRNRVALVPIRIAGRMGFRFLPARDLDDEQWSDFEGRVCRAARSLMGGRFPSFADRADLHQALAYTTDATEREMIAVLEALARLDRREPPGDLGEFGTLCLRVLEAIRGRYLRDLSPGLDLVMGEGGAP